MTTSPLVRSLVRPLVTPLTGRVYATAPVNTIAPVISGTAEIGKTLSATTGTWDNSPASYAYQWQRGGANISGATSSTYNTVLADAGTLITCEVTATNAGGSTMAESNSLDILTLDDIANLQVWLDAMDPSTVLRDTGSGFVPAANGEAVARWVDKSANAHILAQTTAGSRPLLSTSAGPSSGRCIEWDGADDFLVKAGNLFSLPYTMFVVLKQLSYTLNDVIIDSRASGIRMLLIQRNISGMLRTTADSPATNNIQTLNNWDVITVGSSNAQRSVRINAATPGIDSTPITAVDSTEFRIGGATLASTHAHVAIAAIVAYSRSLTADEEAQVRNYLKTQYGTP
jgi:hypothetical protein